jgi:hypothetical protein
MKDHQLYILGEESEDLNATNQWYKIGIRRLTKLNSNNLSKLMSGNPRNLLIKWYIVDSKFFLDQVYRKVVDQLKSEKIKSRIHYTNQVQHMDWYNCDLDKIISLIDEVYRTTNIEYMNTNFDQLFDIE